MEHGDTVAAISTPYGRGGIAVIRISGSEAAEYASRFFVPFSGKRLSDYPGNRTVYGAIYHNGVRIDDGIAAVFRAPHSFTGEDTVEISCHGGIVLAQTVLESAIASGCRCAGAGEFTKRAFLNGKIGLSQAEAVMGLIDAASLESIKLSSAQSRGVLAAEISRLREKLTGIIASVYAYIDYPDEDLTDMTPDELLSGISGLRREAEKLLSTYRTGKAVCEGIVTAILGKPNTGKSSVLNRILGKDRAIVTPVAGTTRDTVEETVCVGRVTLRLCDTAGIRDTDDEVERIGVKRSKELLDSAGLVFAVFDLSSPPDDGDREMISLLSHSSAEVIPVFNKSDLPHPENAPELPEGWEPVCVSAVTGEGFDTLYSRISSLFVSESIDYDTTPVISNARQNAALSAACEHIRSAECALASGFTQDVAGLDLELALGKLGELDGRAVTGEITDCIFSRFCVGK